MADEAFNSASERAVLAALGNPQYEWRTVHGIAKEANLGVEEVMVILGSLANANLIAKSRATTPEGLELFALRETIREKGSIAERILAAINNRAP